MAGSAKLRILSIQGFSLTCLNRSAIIAALFAPYQFRRGHKLMVEPTTTAKIAEDELLRMTADVVAAYVSNNTLPTAQLAEVINTVFTSLRSLDSQPAEAKSEPLKPAVPIRKSITPDYLICLEDGKKLKMLKRHLRSTYNMTPDEYRNKWGLPPDYPMVAPNYAEQRSAFAKKIGLGRGTGRQAGKRSAKK
jgi:predicted transcriptional regulator